jgi:hypothetical protein
VKTVSGSFIAQTTACLDFRNHEEFCEFGAEYGCVPEWDKDGLGLPGIVLYLKPAVESERLNEA